MSSVGHEHEFEPEYGLPEALPAGEQILWQGSPDFATMAVSVFHVRKLVAYFLALLVLRVAFLRADGLVVEQIAASLLWPLCLAVVGIASVTCLAWLSARTTVYTLTSQRVVMRIGIVLTLTFNLPFRSIETADVKLDKRGFGDLAMRLHADNRIAWLHLWPHARPWRLTRPEPTMRCLADGQKVAQQLKQAWSQSTGLVPLATQVSHGPSETAPRWHPSPT